jgi:hypothetical protein
MENIEKRICVFCNKTLKPFKKNGKSYPDWKSRDLHKKCWKLKMKQIKDNYYENNLNNISLVSI